MARPRRPLSQGVRVYEHSPKGKMIYRNSYNAVHGLRMIKLINQDSDLLRIIAVGSEEGAMAVHYRWLQRGEPEPREKMNVNQKLMVRTGNTVLGDALRGVGVA